MPTGTSRADELTTTSFAILGLLGLQEWSTYELAQQMQRSMRLWWPRAESRVYEEPKRLVRLGLATARSEPTGKRPRTVYAITAEGRAALAAWLDEPTGLFRLEFEAMLKIFFADQGTKAQALANVDAIELAAREEWQRGEAFDEDYAATGGPFPERLHLIHLVADLWARLLEATITWAEDARATVAEWPDTTSAGDARAAIAERLAARRRAVPPPVSGPEAG